VKVLQAWIAWDADTFDGIPHGDRAYDVSFQGPGPAVDNHRVAALDAALALARSRTDWIMVRPAWDSSRYYWAGGGPIPSDHWIVEAEISRLDEHR
jgi:hypothetical protein